MEFKNEKELEEYFAHEQKIIDAYNLQILAQVKKESPELYEKYKHDPLIKKLEKKLKAND